MSVIRQANLLGQQRIDIPHLRSIESSIAADFDVLAGRIMAGGNPFVVSGFAVAASIGLVATAAQVVAAGSVIMHSTASEAGTLFQVPATRANETLNSVNDRVDGGFSASAVNYIGVDLRRAADETTSDLVQFINADTNKETGRTVPLARTLDYVITISTLDFSQTPGVAPIAKITTDANNIITAIEDARGLMFRLGTGGAVTNWKHTFNWANGRTEASGNTSFVAGDKSIGSFKDWLDAAMTRMWELGGGEFWYSQTADRNVQLVKTGTPLGSGDQFNWDGTNLTWQGLYFLFDNSTGYYNQIKDQTVNSPGLTNLAAGECIYVDIDRTQNLSGGSALQPVKASLTTLGSPTIPGSRYILAWRNTDGTVSTRGGSGGGTTPTATQVLLGIVKLANAPIDPVNPFVPAMIANHSFTNTASGGNAAAWVGIGNGTGAGFDGTGGGTDGIGVKGTGGASNGIGVKGQGTGTGAGVSGVGGSTAGAGVLGTGGASGGAGVIGIGTGTGGVGISGTGGSGGIGGDFSGGSGNAIGVRTVGAGTGAGVDASTTTTGPALVTRNASTSIIAQQRSYDEGGSAKAITDYLGYRNLGRIVTIHEPFSALLADDGATLAYTYGAFGITRLALNRTDATNFLFDLGINNSATTGVFNPQLTLTVASGASSAAGNYMYASGGVPYFPNKNGSNTNYSMAFEFEVALGSVAGNNGADIFIGWHALDTSDPFASGKNSFGICKRGGTTNDTIWQIVTNTGTGASTFTPLTGMSMANNTLNRFRMEFHGSSSPFGKCLRVFVDGVLRGTVASAGLPAATVATGTMTLRYAFMRKAVGGTAADCTAYLSPYTVTYGRYLSAPDL
jgi:hypothetical protein